MIHLPMIRNALKKSKASLLAACTGIFMLTSPTYATGDWALFSDAGTYAPVVYGTDMQFNACASTISNVNNSAQSYSICDLPSVSKFRLYWYRWEANLGMSYMRSYDGANAASGLTPLFATGAGTFFPIESTYYIGLYLIAEAQSYIDLPGGGQAYTGDGTLSSFRWSNAFDVPEPSAFLLMLPGLAFIARRQRRKFKTA